MAAPQFFSFLLALCILSISADMGFYSIDCGSSTSYKDGNLIDWTGDDEYRGNNGESHSVSSSNSISHVMDTLRVFTTGKKNCYHIGSVKQGRVLVRASFYYGNYDSKSLPPTFDLHFDGNHWTTVETSSTEVVYHEVTYVMKTNSISVCIAQTNPGEFPFISALEVRSLESDMYSHIGDSLPLLLRRRIAFGANSTIRYPDDPYDRMWTPEVISNGLIKVSSINATFGNMLQLKDQPPPAVLKSAVTANSPKSGIQVFMGFPPVEVPVYLNFYFSEVIQLRPDQTRSFIVFKDNMSFSKPVFPPYGNCTQLYTNNTRASSSTTFSLVRTVDSTLPPLINAMETFVVGDVLTNGTNNGDVQGLASLQKAFAVLQDWRGDPCLPAPYTWDWVDCSTDPTPRVTAMFLGNFGLSGILPDFSSMDALETIDFHNNSLQGPIPDFLGTFSDLKTLVTGNPNLCTSVTSCPTSSKNPIVNLACSIKCGNILTILFGTIIPFLIIPFRENHAGI
ncbi:Non-specific serine/threonine protein kinase [Handroanthus impetiginosus]|uniref:Non-specific serine/threonine protein kinase n=1 Tax=Handroanthus impetiginosus TaxID=429701 RepID=A0A2G9GQJ1_9LAMI|nr:Non-specific serine/threonine protein kinase [Handroanthus impetiginosus]